MTIMAMGYGSYGYGGASGTGLPIAATESRLPQRGEHRPTDTTAGLLVALERRIVDRTARGPVFARRTLPECQAHPAWRRLQAGPRDTVEYPCSAVADSHVSSAGRQVKFEVHAMGWSPDGRRLVSCNSEGYLTQWSGLDFSHAPNGTIQGHVDINDNSGVKINALAWLKRSPSMFITGDEQGCIQYWQPTLKPINPSNSPNLIPEKGILRGSDLAIATIAVAPTSLEPRFCFSGADKKIRLWDLVAAREEAAMEGHGDRVNCVAWHPSYALIASGSKDNTIRLWDPRAGAGRGSSSSTNLASSASSSSSSSSMTSTLSSTTGASSSSKVSGGPSSDADIQKNAGVAIEPRRDSCLATIMGHKADVTHVAWNPCNGNWLLSASKDNTLRCFDIRSLREPISFVGHNKEVNTAAWHPTHERIFASGASDGSLGFWQVGSSDRPQKMCRIDERDLDINP